MTTEDSTDRAPNPDGEVVLVTGSSSGIGEATVRALESRGIGVMAGVRSTVDAERLRGQLVEPLKLDITDPAHIDSVADRLGDDNRRLVALVNNAGAAINAPVELLPLEEWRRQFEVNFFGHVALTQALLPRLFADRGRVVNVSSIGGLVAGPTFGAYAASKFALEALSDALRREVAGLGIRVVVIEPGAVATPIWDKGLATSETILLGAGERAARYRELISAVQRQAQAAATGGMDPAQVAEVIVKAIESTNPRTRYAVGRDARLMSRLARLLPDTVLDRMIRRGLGLRRRSV
jgi:NAD(P)-dependent dehydrogenase (short-subunit alcohol dehydrogenase family)